MLSKLSWCNRHRCLSSFHSLTISKLEDLKKILTIKDFGEINSFNENVLKHIATSLGNWCEKVVIKWAITVITKFPVLHPES